MKKILAISLIALGANLYAVTLDRRVELLENAVVKLINENTQLKNQMAKKDMEINALKKEEEINNQTILALKNSLEALKANKNTIYARVNSFGLNVREKPTAKSKIVDRLKKGDLVKIYGAEVNSGTIWYKISNGYISSNFVSLVYGGNLKEDKIKAPVISFSLPKIKIKKETNETKTIRPKDLNNTKIVLIGKKRPPEFNNTQNNNQLNNQNINKKEDK